MSVSKIPLLGFGLRKLEKMRDNEKYLYHQDRYYLLIVTVG